MEPPNYNCCVSPGLPPTSTVHNGQAFVKSEEIKFDFMNQVSQIMSTTQASLNGYFPSSLQNMVSTENYILLPPIRVILAILSS